MNNSRNKSEECNKPFQEAPKPEKPKAMAAWLTGETKRKSNVLKFNADITSNDIDTDAKRLRMEENKTDDEKIEAKIKVEPSLSP